MLKLWIKSNTLFQYLSPRLACPSLLFYCQLFSWYFPVDPPPPNLERKYTENAARLVKSYKLCLMVCSNTLISPVFSLSMACSGNIEWCLPIPYKYVQIIDEVPLAGPSKMAISKPDLEDPLKIWSRALRFDHLCLYLSHRSWKKNN